MLVACRTGYVRELDIIESHFLARSKEVLVGGVIATDELKERELRKPIDLDDTK